MGLDIGKEIVKAAEKVEQYNQQAESHNAMIREKIYELKQAEAKLLQLQFSVSLIKTDSIKKAGDNVWSGAVNRKYLKVTDDVDNDIKKFNQAIGDAISHCGREILHLTTQFEPTLPLPGL